VCNRVKTSVTRYFLQLYMTQGLPSLRKPTVPCFKVLFDVTFYRPILSSFPLPSFVADANVHDSFQIQQLESFQRLDHRCSERQCLGPGKTVRTKLNLWIGNEGMPAFSHRPRSPARCGIFRSAIGFSFVSQLFFHSSLYRNMPTAFLPNEI
jgi:hypothetical protein